MDATFWFHFVKLLHIAGLILWLGPSGGAWLLVQLSKRRLDQQSIEYKALYRDFLKFFWVEHLGLFLLLGSGVLLLSMYGYTALDWTWIRIKLALVLCVLLPIEALDIWFGHVRLPRLFSSPERHTDSRQKMTSLELYERRFVPVSLPILLATVVVIMWLAIAKPI
jgi:uncharacterized membrane protein